jgi:hypothetical protein
MGLVEGTWALKTKTGGQSTNSSKDSVNSEL